MPNVIYFLKKPEAKSGRSLIILKFKYRGKELVFSTGENIDPKTWDKEKDRVKSNKATTANGDYSLNDFLGALREQCLQKYKSELKNGIPEPQVLRDHLKAYIRKNRDGEETPATGKTLYGLIERFISGEIRHRGKDRGIGTRTKYQTIYNHLKEFEKATGYRVDYDTINYDFRDKLISYLKKREVVTVARSGERKVQKGLKANTIAKAFTILKTFLNEAVERGETDNQEFKKKGFRMDTEETDAVYLTEAELNQLYRHNLSDNKRLEAVRDLFIFSSHVGLRYSDASSVKPENIVTIEGQQFVKIITKKTGELVVIPCHPVVLEIFEKYKDSPNRLPRAISGQRFNEYLKEACELAGLTETGRLSTDPAARLCDVTSSHTARRSFASNLYLQGFPTLDIMKITGHKTEKSFLLYVKVSKLDAAKRLAAHQRNRWENKLVKVA
ncbi:site-specific integrase [Flaviaesturariibacter amylovorans]|uniref:Site-specific integrase n=1 Tax=Flaviaesturariibacter amylovorans TaxID=1084520 RepID=A0ABP8GPU7_9BACT